MFLSRVFRVRNLALLALVLILGASAYAFAAANVVPESGAGDGAETISGYTVTDVRYTLGAADPTKIDSVKFDIAATAGASAPVTVKVQLVDAGAWFACAVTTSPEWSCSVASAVNVADADQLRVVAAQ
ncbi:MAG: hypothetical protein AUK03_05830 [Anaerolineae bacterium CG2_30_64_16]|nr:MAG: hypothetical protein AUK03_05830 [Anaerolineae bacterium CG2_30_64_16]